MLWQSSVILNIGMQLNTSEINDQSLVFLLEKLHSEVYNKGVYHLQKWITALQYNPLCVHLPSYSKRAASGNSIHVVGFIFTKKQNQYYINSKYLIYSKTKKDSIPYI